MARGKGKKPAKRGRNDWIACEKDNARFNTYYKQMNLVSSEEEWKQFSESIRTPLGTAFRLSRNHGHHKLLLPELLRLVDEVKDLTFQVPDARHNIGRKEETREKKEGEAETAGEGEASGADGDKSKGKNSNVRPTKAFKLEPKRLEWYPEVRIGLSACMCERIDAAK